MSVLKKYFDEDPNSVFIVSGKQKYTSRKVFELVSARVDKFTSILSTDRVALVPKNSAEDIISLLALVEIGCGVVLLNNRLLERDRRHLIEISEATVVIKGVTPIRIPGSNGRKRLDTEFILFTSGTSGTPKGVILNLRNFESNARASLKRLGLERGDRWLLTLPLFHVGGLAILFRSLFLGLTMVLQERFDAESVLELANTGEVNILSVVPTMLYRMVKKNVDPLKNLKVILLGGAKPSDSLLQLCVNHRLPIYTTYGMTESCSQIATASPEMVYRDRTTVGHPLEGMSITIVDKRGEEVGRGETGLIAIDGEQLFEGYLHSGRSLPFVTGDVGYLDDKGELHVMGRADDTIISGGENIYPLEIEDVITSYQGVRRACATGIQDDEWGERVEVMVEGDFDKDRLIEYLRLNLPGFKVPKRIVIGEIPLTSSGKMNRAEVSRLLAQTP